VDVYRVFSFHFTVPAKKKQKKNRRKRVKKMRKLGEEDGDRPGGAVIGKSLLRDSEHTHFLPRSAAPMRSSSRGDGMPDPPSRAAFSRAAHIRKGRKADRPKALIFTGREPTEIVEPLANAVRQRRFTIVERLRELR